jgi:hypothetical protein
MIRYDVTFYATTLAKFLDDTIPQSYSQCLCPGLDLLGMIFQSTGPSDHGPPKHGGIALA